ncbi:unnamed protein product, partial [marine sediment metagenome]
GAINLGEPLSRHGPKSKVRIAVQKIAERLYATDPATDTEDEKKRSLLGRIFAAD